MSRSMKLGLKGPFQPFPTHDSRAWLVFNVYHQFLSLSLQTSSKFKNCNMILLESISIPYIILTEFSVCYFTQLITWLHTRFSHIKNFKKYVAELSVFNAVNPCSSPVLNFCILYVRVTSLSNDDLSRTSQCLKNSLWICSFFCGLCDVIAQRDTLKSHVISTLPNLSHTYQKLEFSSDRPTIQLKARSFLQLSKSPV